MVVGPIVSAIPGKENLAPIPTVGTWEAGQEKQALTHFTDSEGAGVASVNLGRATSREVKQFYQARYHLILLLGVAQAAIATKAPGEDSLLGVQDQLE